MDTVIQWIKDIFIIIISLTFLEILIPNSNMEKYIKFIFSLIILSIIISPLKYLCNI